MSEIVETIKYRGCEIEVCYYEDFESPEGWNDEQEFLVGYHRDFRVSNDKMSEELAGAIISEQTDDEYLAELAEHFKQGWHIFGLEAYIHSSVRLAIKDCGDFPDRQWDVSLVGLVAISKKEAKTPEIGRVRANNLIENWNDYLSGSVYGFRAKSGNYEIDSCCGFYGDYDKSGLLDEAKSSIDRYIERKTASHCQGLKHKIIKKVEISHRSPLKI